jgi:hypothetical protein
MEFVGWVCVTCRRALNSGKQKFKHDSRVKCYGCNKSTKLISTIHSSISGDSLVITDWVKKYNSTR